MPMPKGYSVNWPQRFHDNVDRRGPDECWPWTGDSKSEHGYGLVWKDGKLHKAHRVALALARGVPIPPASVKIRHSCDNPPCCNDAHLLPGTQADNVRDMADRKRHGAHGPHREEFRTRMAAVGRANKGKRAMR